MPPTSKKLMGHIGFGLSVRACVHLSVRASFRQEPCMLGFWNFIYGFPMEKYLTHNFFSCPSYLPFWSYAPSNKIQTKSDACHIWSFEISFMDSLWKNSWPFFFFCLSCLPFWSYALLKNSEWNLVTKIFWKSIWARGLKLGQLIGDDK